ncbi:MAG: LysR family transcriptional regulator [Gammaproteobacteria bacterium]|nr:LysR family transcriptional regulator [Gammaproteobacteria bacterium]
MLRLQLSHYRVVQAVRIHGTVSAAAQALGLTQPALSHQIAEAERRLSTKLFARVGRRLRLTSAGELLATSADTILMEAGLAESTLMGKTDTAAGEVVRIGTFAYNSYRWLPLFLKQLQHQWPNLYFEFITDTHKVPMRSVLDGDVDIAISAGGLAASGTHVCPLFEDELLAIGAMDSPIPDHGYMLAADFLNDPFITYSTIYETGFEEELLWRPAGRRPLNYLRAGNTEAVIAMVKAGFGRSILSCWAVQPHVDNNSLIALKVTPKGMPVSWSALVRKNHPNISLLNAVSEQLQAWCQVQFRA